MRSYTTRDQLHRQNRVALIESDNNLALFLSSEHELNVWTVNMCAMQH